MAKAKLPTVGRRNQILTQLTEKGEVFVDKLSKEFDVSEVTIRNDLNQLEKKRLLIRARGGAMKFEGGVAKDFHLEEKDKIHLKEKMKIGKTASTLVNEGDVIIIDSGTTTAELAKRLIHLNNVTVITNAINIAKILTSSPGINVIMLGGALRPNSESLVGPIAEKTLSRFHVDKVFLGVDGIDLASGFYTPNIEEAHLNEQMIKVGNQIIVLADSSKFNKQSFAHICDFEEAHIIVTNKNIDEDLCAEIESLGTQMILA